MNLQINENAQINGKNAAALIASKINAAIAKKGEARILLSTGASQFEMFENLVTLDVDWSKVTMFHLDEYVGLPITHGASFRKYLKERFISKVPLKAANLVGDIPLDELSAMVKAAPIDVGVIGIGENGHIAFNDPPADFDTDKAYIIVDLDERCRMQQVGEGWFENLEAVPKQAVSMAVKQIMQCESIVSVVPHAVKAEAIYNTFTKTLTNKVPATMLKQHKDWSLFIDYDAAKLIYDMR